MSIKPQFEEDDFVSCLPFFEKKLEDVLKRQLRVLTLEDLTTLNETLPIIEWNILGHTLKATLLAPAAFTEGAGRYFSDSLSRWLNPGKFLKIMAVHSLDFRFHIPNSPLFFISHVVLDISDQESNIVHAHLPRYAAKVQPPRFVS
jgi:hypothetical protein